MYAAPNMAGRAAPSCASLKIYKYGMGGGGWGGLLGDSSVLPNSSLSLYINTLYRFHLIINTHCTFVPPREKTNKQTPNPETEGQTPWNSNSEWNTKAPWRPSPFCYWQEGCRWSLSPHYQAVRTGDPGQAQTEPLPGQTAKLCDASVLLSTMWGLWRPHRAAERIKWGPCVGGHSELYSIAKNGYHYFSQQTLSSVCGGGFDCHALKKEISYIKLPTPGSLPHHLFVFLLCTYHFLKWPMFSFFTHCLFPHIKWFPSKTWFSSVLFSVVFPEPWTVPGTY